MIRSAHNAAITGKLFTVKDGVFVLDTEQNRKQVNTGGISASIMQGWYEFGETSPRCQWSSNQYSVVSSRSFFKPHDDT